MAGGFLMVAALGGLALGVLAEGCAGTTPQQVVNGETTALNLTNAACSVADTTGDAYVVFGCALADIGLDSAIAITNLFVSVPVAGAADFATKHAETPASKPLVVAYKSLHPTASAGPLK